MCELLPSNNNRLYATSWMLTRGVCLQNWGTWILRSPSHEHCGPFWTSDGNHPRYSFSCAVLESGPALLCVLKEG